MNNKELNEYILTFSDGTKGITRHYEIEPVKSVYLNENVRLRDGTLKYCIDVELLLKL
jgi:hypothetical protein